MSLIKTTDEIQKYLITDASFDPKTILPYIEPAEYEVQRMLGKVQYEELDDYYEASGTGIAELDALLPIVQRPLVYFAFLKGLDVFNVSIGNNGIAIVSNNTLVPASKERIENLRKNILDSAFDALEALLIFLEDNIDDYPLWESSDAYAYQYEFLIGSARKFDELIKIERSRLTFLKWRPAMADVELLQMDPVVSKDLMDELKTQIKAGTVTVNNQKILPHLQKALAYLTASIELDQKYKNRGEHYLMIVKRLLDAAPDDYPTYKNSSVYIEDLTSYEKYENTEDSNFIVVGG